MVKIIRKIGAKFWGLSRFYKYVLVWCVVIVVTTVYVCNSIKVNGKQKETDMKEVNSSVLNEFSSCSVSKEGSISVSPNIDSIINNKEKEDELIAIEQPVETEQVVQPVETQQVVQPVETQQVVQPVETEQVVQPVETEQVVQPVETQQVVQPVETQQVVQPVGTEQVVQPVETQQVVQSVNNANIHKNSINGIEYKLMNQADAAWKNIKYPTRSGTIGSIGCMITSVAVVSSAYDKTMTPKKVMDKGYQHNYPSNSIPYFSGSNYKCTMSSSSNKNTIIDNLKQGNVVVIKVKGASKFTTSQHYMALIDIKSDGSQIFVGNAYGSGTGTYNRSGWFATDIVLYDVHEVHICVPSQTLINQYK